MNFLSFLGKWMELENIILSQGVQTQKAKITCSPSYAEYRPTTNAITFLDMGHTLRGEGAREE
jgi:hypothetical protein